MSGARTGFAIAIAAAVFAAIVPARAEDADAAYLTAPLERDIVKLLFGRSEAGSFIFHYRPGSRAEKERDAFAKRLEEGWRKLRARLDVKPRAKVNVFLYDTSLEMTRLTGETAESALEIGGSVHAALDQPEAAAPALVRILERLYAGDRVGGGLEGGRTYRLRILSRGKQLEAFLDERRFLEIDIEAQPGGLTFGVEGGRVLIRELKLREAPADPTKTPNAPWAYPLRGGAEWAPDIDGVWKAGEDSLEGTRPSRMSRTRLGAVALRDLEMDCSFRVSEGATAEIGLHVGIDRSTRLVFTASMILVDLHEQGKLDSRRLATGPRPGLREGFVEALAAEVEGRSLHGPVRALLDRNLVPSFTQVVRSAIPSSGIERPRRRAILGSFVAFCLEKHGVQKYRDLHFYDLRTDRTPLGELEKIEEAWRAHLRGLRRTEAESRKTDRDWGLDILAGAAGWRDLTPAARERKFRTEGGGSWTADRNGLAWEGAQGAPPGRAIAPEQAAVSGAFRATLRFGEGSRARIGLGTRDGKTTLALVSANGASLLTPDNTIAARSDAPLAPDRWYDLAIVLEGGAGRVYLDGLLVGEAQGLAQGPGTWRIEAEGRRVEVRAVAARGL